MDEKTLKELEAAGWDRVEVLDVEAAGFDPREVLKDDMDDDEAIIVFRAPAGG